MSRTHDGYWRFEVDHYELQDKQAGSEGSRNELVQRLGRQNSMLPTDVGPNYYKLQLSRLALGKSCCWKWTEKGDGGRHIWNIALARKVLSEEELKRMQDRCQKAPTEVAQYSKAAIFRIGHTKEDIIQRLVRSLEEDEKSLHFKISDLPRELRNLIGQQYVLAFPDDPLHAPTMPPAARTCRQMRLEWLPIFFSTCTFDIRLLTQADLLEFNTMAAQRCHSGFSKRTKFTIDAYTLQFFAMNDPDMLRHTRHLRVVHVKQMSHFRERELQKQWSINNRYKNTHVDMFSKALDVCGQPRVDMDQTAIWTIDVGTDKVLTVRCDPRSRFYNHTETVDMQSKTERAVEEFFQALLFPGESPVVWKTLGVNEITGLRMQLDKTINNTARVS